MPATSALGSAFPKQVDDKHSGAVLSAAGGSWLSNFFNRDRLPHGWDGHKIDVNGEKAFIFNSPAKNPRAVAIYISGLQSSPLEYIGGINSLRDRGISVVSFSLLPATESDLSGEKCRFIKRNSRLFEEILLNPKSKIHGMGGGKSLPRYVVPHSTASLVLQYTLAHGDNHDKALKLYDGAYNLNPFFDAGPASKHNPTRSWLYHAFGKMNASKAVMSTLVEKIVMGRGEKSYYYGAPTHGLVLGILEKSRPFVEKFLENPLPGTEGSSQKFHQTFVVGTKDSLVCNITTHEVAQALGSSVHEHPIDHSEALYHEGSLQHLIETIQMPRSDRHNKASGPPLINTLMPGILNRFL